VVSEVSGEKALLTTYLRNQIVAKFVQECMFSLGLSVLVAGTHVQTQEANPNRGSVAYMYNKLEGHKKLATGRAAYMSENDAKSLTYVKKSIMASSCSCQGLVSIGITTCNHLEDTEIAEG
jgi:hypothetical protein